MKKNLVYRNKNKNRGIDIQRMKKITLNLLLKMK